MSKSGGQSPHESISPCVKETSERICMRYSPIISAVNTVLFNFGESSNKMTSWKQSLACTATEPTGDLTLKFLCM